MWLLLCFEQMTNIFSRQTSDSPSAETLNFLLQKQEKIFCFVLNYFVRENINKLIQISKCLTNSFFLTYFFMFTSAQAGY